MSRILTTVAYKRADNPLVSKTSFPQGILFATETCAGHGIMACDIDSNLAGRVLTSVAYIHISSLETQVRILSPLQGRGQEA
jgi:hypothetical protein